MGIDDRPPTPKYVSNAVRVLEVSILVVMAAWVFGPLHGVRITPKKVGRLQQPLLLCFCLHCQAGRPVLLAHAKGWLLAVGRWCKRHAAAVQLAPSHEHAGLCSLYG